MRLHFIIFSYLFLVLKLYYLEISSCNNQINKQYACQIKDTVNLLENIAEIVDSKELYDIHFYKNLETKSNTKMLETIYSYNDSVYLGLYNHQRENEIFTPLDDIGRNDYFIYKDQKFYFDSLVSEQNKSVSYLKKYAQCIAINNVYTLKYHTNEYLFIVASDIFIYGSFQRYDIYLFSVSENDLKFISYLPTEFNTPSTIGDFDGDGNLDLIAFENLNTRDEKAYCYSIVNNSMKKQNEMYLRIIYPPDKDFKPHIIVSESKFPPLNKYLERLEKRNFKTE